MKLTKSVSARILRAKDQALKFTPDLFADMDFQRASPCEISTGTARASVMRSAATTRTQSRDNALFTISSLVRTGNSKPCKLAPVVRGTAAKKNDRSDDDDGDNDDDMSEIERKPDIQVTNTRRTNIDSLISTGSIDTRSAPLTKAMTLLFVRRRGKSKG